MLSWYVQCIDFLLIRCVEAWITLVFRFVLVLKVGMAHAYQAWLSWYFSALIFLYKVCGGLNCTSISIRASFKSGCGTCLSSMARLILQCIDFLFIRGVETWIALEFWLVLFLKVGVAHVYQAWLSWYFYCIDFLFIRCV